MPLRGLRRPLRIRRARPVWHDPDLERLLKSIRSEVAVALHSLVVARVDGSLEISALD